MSEIYVIECRRADGSLDFSEPQPETFFGNGAITGIDDDTMAKAIFRQVPDAILSGDAVSVWPRVIDPRWIARRKTW
jgi:hypothetical protein